MNLLSFFTESEIKPKKKEWTPFRLPITYMEDKKHTLSPTVATDLELDQLITEPDKNVENPPTPIYHYLFQPKTEFAKKTIPLWKTHFTSNVPYLQETQSILSQMKTYQTNMQQCIFNKKFESVDHDNIMNIWRNTKEDPEFLEKYSYMDIDYFSWVNRMPIFLQTTSFVNMTSPVLALIIPFIFLLAPFLILQFQGVSITFTAYLDALYSIAKYHFIGKAVNMLRNFSATNAIYLLMMLGFYLYQCYNNYMFCVRFYRQIREMNRQILDMRNYLDYSVESMQQFLQISSTCQQYKAFQSEVFRHMSNLREFRQILANVAPFEPSLSKMSEIGLLMRCFYEMYENDVYSESVFWSFGFEGFMGNLSGVYENLCERRVAYTKYTGISNVEISDQYYPAHMHHVYVSNHCHLDKNMIITGPNAAGKTTFLKTTMLNVLFSQQFGCGFYSDCQLQPYTNIHSYLNIPDTSARDSLFQAESRRCKEILDAVVGLNAVGNEVSSKENLRHFCVFDELYSGTNPEEATKSAYAFLRYLAKYDNVNFILTTHYVSVCKRLRKVPTVRNWKMEAHELADGEIKYTYKIGRGISQIQGAFSVLREMGYPEEILNEIRNYDDGKKKKEKK